MTDTPKTPKEWAAKIDDELRDAGEALFPSEVATIEDVIRQAMEQAAGCAALKEAALDAATSDHSIRELERQARGPTVEDHLVRARVAYTRAFAHHVPTANREAIGALLDAVEALAKGCGHG